MNTAHGEGAGYGICLSLLAGCCVLSCEIIAAPLPSSPSPSCQRLRQILRNLPAVRATVARPPCNRRNRSTLARLNRAENGLASRPPLRPCPRPSEMRRAFCKPSATVCNAISASRPATVRAACQRFGSPRRIPANVSGNRSRFRPVSDSGNIERAAPCQYIRQRGNRPPVASRGDRPRRFAASLSVKDSGKPWRTCRNRSGLSAISGDRVPDSSQHRTRQGFRQRRASCHHRTRRADSGQCRRILQAVRATVARPPCSLSIHRRQPLDDCPPARRKRPRKPSAWFGHISQGRLIRDRVGAFPFGYALAPVSRGKPSAFARLFKGRGKLCRGRVESRHKRRKIKIATYKSYQQSSLHKPVYATFQPFYNLQKWFLAVFAVHGSRGAFRLFGRIPIRRVATGATARACRLTR